ncbi:MAG: hypothetical protein DA405_09910 [Bacteroidetes bacterium]|nr:MAG: hypothetical protein DA405_09910 [Bacteroidota bacterium]
MNKLFGNLHLVWRKGRGHRRISVGLVKSNATDGLVFQYLPDGVAMAKLEGFQGYPGLTLDKEIQTSNILDVFSQRLLKPERQDVKSYYQFWQVDSDYRANPLRLLAYTQGLLPTDNFEFLADFNPIRGQQFITELAGLSHSQVKLSEVQLGDELHFKKEPDNSRDKYAVAIYGSRKLGYVKIVHSRIFYKNPKSRPKISIHHIEGKNQVTKLFLKICIS